MKVITEYVHQQKYLYFLLSIFPRVEVIVGSWTHIYASPCTRKRKKENTKDSFSLQ